MHKLTQKINEILHNKEEMLELVRYIVAGVLTTVLSLIISYGCYILLSADHTINGATTTQVMIGNVASWIISVIFAFWINRKMVFRVEGGDGHSKTREFIEFAGARIASFALFEEGLAAILSLVGVTNVVNRLIILVLVTVFNYVASKFWIFKKKS